MEKNKLGAFLASWVLLCCCLFLLGLCVFDLDAEVIKLKNGNSISGEIQEIKKDHIIIEIPNGQTSVFFKDMVPQSVYDIRLQAIDLEDAQAHLDLAEYCLTHTLYTLAQKEFEEAARLDDAFEEIVTQKTKALAEQESQYVLKRAYDLIKEEKYKAALEQLQVLFQKYPESQYAEEAKKIAAFTGEAAKHKIEEEVSRKEMLVQQKENEKLERVERALREKFSLALTALKQARQLNSDALNWESKSQFSRAVKAYGRAERELLNSEKLLGLVVNQTQDVELMTSAQKHFDDLKEWFITIYNNLGQLHAYQLNFHEALRWLNRTLAVDPHNKIAQELKLKIIDIEARRRLLNESQD